MTSKMYEYVCTTCDTSEMVEELRKAQEYFNEHADQGCEVALRNVSSSVSPVATESVHSDARTKETQPAEE